MKNQVGYCTNVHAGVTLDEVKLNLGQYAVAVRDQVANTNALPVGLWLSETAAQELVSESSRFELRDWLLEHKLDAFTFNGFPFGNFHQAVVKHSVYKPTWAETARLEYTKRLADIHAVLMLGDAGTISTLPLGWPCKNQGKADLQKCGDNLIELSQHLAELKKETGKSIRVCIEPEPGCLFDRAEHLVDFFQEHLFSREESDSVRKHLGVCHDVCHSAVMFERQDHAVDCYAKAGIEIGKVQVSSAVQVNFDSADDMEKAWMLKSLAEFNEPRYLHQTSVWREGQVTFFEDLPLAVEAVEELPQGVWRIHFHVPIFQPSMGNLQTTQSDIKELVTAIRKRNLNPQWEVETYAWNVLPEEFRGESLDQSITREIQWFQSLLAE
jgi:sugar phosphate isomerase/epimerase